jgi:hypothetical protein
MTTLTELTTVQDIVKVEMDSRLCREVMEVYAGQSLSVGDVCEAYSSSNDAKKQVAGAVADVQTMTFQAGADGGTFGVKYKGKPTAALAYNVSAADLQTAVRALHADLAATVVTTVGGVGVDYVFTTAAMACDDLVISGDQILDGEVAEPATMVHTTQGSASGGLADSICLEAGTCVNEVQGLVFGGTPTNGTFTLSLVNKLGAVVTTTGLAYNASAATISTAIDVALGESAQCVVTGTTLPDQTLTATWSGASYSGRHQELITANLASLTGGTPTCTITRTYAGAQGECVFLVRGPAVVDKAYLDFNSVTEANAIAALATQGIIVRTGPTYTTLD